MAKKKSKPNINKAIQKQLEKEAVSVKLSFKYFVAVPVIIILTVVIWIMYSQGYLQKII